MSADLTIPRAVWFGLEGKGYDNIAQELKSEDPLLRVWASIYAIYKYEITTPHQYYDFIHNTKDSRFAIVVFTIPQKTIETSDGIDDRDITIVNIEKADSEIELYKHLEHLNINPTLFTPPWKCDYPL